MSGNGTPLEATPEPPSDERIDEVLKANGYMAIRSELVGAANALRQVPLEACDVGLAYLARRRDDVPQGASDQARDQMDAERWTFEVLRKARAELVEVDKRIVARAELRR